jgi:hypothetical protein
MHSIKYTCACYITQLFTCVGTQMSKGCVGHLLQNFMLARVFVVSKLKIKKYTHHRVIICDIFQIPKMSDENILLRFDSTFRNTETTKPYTYGLYS